MWSQALSEGDDIWVRHSHESSLCSPRRHRATRNAGMLSGHRCLHWGGMWWSPEQPALWEGRWRWTLCAIVKFVQGWANQGVGGYHEPLDVCCPPPSPSQVRSSHSFPHPFLHLTHPKLSPAHNQKLRGDENRLSSRFTSFLWTHLIVPRITRSPGSFASWVFSFLFSFSCCFSNDKIYLGSRRV